MSEETVVAPEATHEFNKELQQVQQEKANFQKRAQTLESQNVELRAELSKVPEPVQQSEGELDAYEQVERTKQDMLSMQSELANTKNLLESQQSTINNINQKADYEKQLEQLDGQYGAQNRNAAIARATQRCKDAGYTLQGTDHPKYADMVTVVRESYIHEYYQGKEKASTPVVKPTTDNGIGGSSFVDLGDGIPEGSMEEVIAAMQKQR